jgi:hypothetical protein
MKGRSRPVLGRVRQAFALLIGGLILAAAGPLATLPATAQEEARPSYRVTGQVGGSAGAVAAAVDAMDGSEGGSAMVAAFGRRAARVALTADGGAIIGPEGPALPGQILALAAFTDGQHAAAIIDGHRLALLGLAHPEGPRAHSVVGLPGHGPGSTFVPKIAVAEGRIFVGLQDRLVIFALADAARPLPPPVADLPLWVTADPVALDHYLIVPVRGEDDFTRPLFGLAPNTATTTGFGSSDGGTRPAWSGLRVLDLHDPTRPLVVADVSLAHGAPLSLAAAGTTLVAAQREGVSVIDAADPRRPRVVAEIEEDASAVAVGRSPIGPPVALLASQHNVRVSRPRAPSFDVPEIRLIAVDLSRPSTPRVLGRHGFRGAQELTGLAVAAGRAALADRTTGLRLLDLASPTTGLPVLARREASPIRLVATDRSTGLAVALGQAGDALFQRVGLQQLLVIDSLSRTIRAELGGLAPAEDLVLQGDIAALAGPTGLQLIDLSDPDQPRLAGLRTDLVDARRVMLSGSLAAVADGAGGLRLFDISDPSRPTPLSSLPLSEPVTAIGLRGTHAYVTTPRTLHAIDLSDRLRPRHLAATDPAPLEDPGDPFRESVNTLFDLVLAGDFAYASDGFRDLHVFDIAHSDRPRNIAQLPFGLAGRLVAGKDRLWQISALRVSGRATNRLIVFGRDDPGAPEQLVDLVLPPAVHDAAVLRDATLDPAPGADPDGTLGDDLLVAADAAGLLWLDEGPDAPPTPQPSPGVTATRRPPPAATAQPPDPAGPGRIFLPLTLRPSDTPKSRPLLSPPVLEGGVAGTLAVAGDRAWLAVGRRLVLFVAREGEDPAPRDTLDLPSPARLVAGDTQVAAIILQPELALDPPLGGGTVVPPEGGYPGPALASHPAGGGERLNTGLRLIVADADGLRTAATRTLDGPATALHMMSVGDRRVLLVARWTAYGEGEAWLDVFDATRPSFPELLIRWPLPGAVLRMADDKGRLLLSLAGITGPHGLLALDLSRPELPREIGFTPLSSNRSAPRAALTIIEGRAYVGMSDDWIDVLELGEQGPALIGRIATSNQVSLRNYVDIAGLPRSPLLHVLIGEGAWIGHFDLRDLREVPLSDVSQPAAHFERSLSLPAPPRMAASGGRLFVAGGVMGGLRTMELDRLGQEQNPIRHRRGGGPGHVDRLAHGRVEGAAGLVAATAQGDLIWMRTGSPPSDAFQVRAQQVGGGDLIGPITDLVVEGSSTWLTGLLAPLVRLSVVEGEARFDLILTPEFGFQEEVEALPPSHRRIAIAEDMAWLAEAATGLRVFDLATDGLPRQIGLHHTPGRARDLALTASHALIADGPDGLVVLDRRNPAAPREVGHRDLGGDAVRVLAGEAAGDARAWLAVLPRGAGAESRFPGVGRRGARLVEVDLRDPTRPRVAAELALPAEEAHALARRDGLLLIAAGQAGLLVVDVTEPGRPLLVRQVDPATRVKGGSGARLESALQIPPRPRLSQARTRLAGLTGGGPSLPALVAGPGAVDVSVATDPGDRRIFVALGEDGLATIRIEGP